MRLDLVFAVMLAAFGIVFVRGAVRAYRRAGAIRGWPSTAGHVTAGEVKTVTFAGSRRRTPTERYTPVISYTYVVDGHTHHGRFEEGDYASRKDAEDRIAQYRRKLAVRYDPHNPPDSDVPWSMPHPMLAAILLVPAAICFVAAAYLAASMLR